jgi:hypothetical protein
VELDPPVEKAVREGFARGSGLELIRSLGFDRFAVHFLEFDAVKMLRENVQVSDLMRRLWTHRPALRRVPVRVFKLSAVGLRIAVNNVIGAFGLNSIEGKYGGPDVTVQVFRLAWLDVYLKKANVVVFEENGVVLRGGVDRFHRVGPMPNHACLALRPGTGYKRSHDSSKESGD